MMDLPPVPPANVEVREVPWRYGHRLEYRVVWVGPPVPGDFDSDNDCDLDDLLAVAGMPLVDLDDLLLVQANMGYADGCVWVCDGQRLERVTFGQWRRWPAWKRWHRVTVAYD